MAGYSDHALIVEGSSKARVRRTRAAPLHADPDWATHQRGPSIDRDYARDRDQLKAALLANARGG
jgi:hypothetical protein